MSRRLTASRTPTLAEVLRASMDAFAGELHTALPGRVESYDVDAQTATVKPLVQRVVIDASGEEITESLPVLTGVPMQFPRAGGFFVSLPIAQGDLGMLIFAEASLDKWLAGRGEEVDPVDPRRHDLSDAWFIPGGYPSREALADAHESNLVVGKDGGTQAHFKDGEISLGSENAVDFVAQAAKVVAELGAIVTGFNGHVHPVTTAPGTTGPPAPLLVTPGSVAASVVKAD